MQRNHAVIKFISNTIKYLNFTNILGFISIKQINESISALRTNHMTFDLYRQRNNGNFAMTFWRPLKTREVAVLTFVRNHVNVC